MVFSGAGLFLPAEAHKAPVCCVCLCQTAKLQTILIWAPSSSEAGTGWRPRRLKSKCKVGRPQWAILQERGSLLFSICTCACCVHARTELTGGSAVWRSEQGTQGEDAPRWPVVYSSLAGVAGSLWELCCCLNLRAVKRGWHDIWHVEGGWRALDESWKVNRC